MHYITDFFANYGQLGVFIISMLPIIELRGAIPVGLSMGLPVIPTYIVAVLGNIVVVPAIFFCAQYVLTALCRIPKAGIIFQKMLDKGNKAGLKFGQYKYWALLLFVAIPLPGTGAWTGTLAASLLNLKFGKTMLAVTGGVITAGIIMAIVSLGAFSVFDFFVR